MVASIGKLIDTPPVWLLLFALLVWGLGEMFPGTALGSGALRGLGTGLVIFGCALIVMASWQFFSHKTTIIPHRKPANIITSGIYTLSRNPIYLADATILAGLCLRWDVLPGLLLVPVFLWLIQTRFITGEEKRLARAFPTEFSEYASKTRRWL
jgi:protein-S-isoprenylcysteine O-methyltransferase Ste14